MAQPLVNALFQVRKGCLAGHDTPDQVRALRVLDAQPVRQKRGAVEGAPDAAGGVELAREFGPHGFRVGRSVSGKQQAGGQIARAQRVLDAFAEQGLDDPGRVADKQPWTRERLAELPQREVIIRHICVEGWDYIGQWSGVPLRTFLERVGADLSARYVAFRCADDYWGSIDMPSALHAQTLLATHYARDPIADPYGYPLRLRTAVKLGFKNPKWITAIEVTNDYPGGYWEDRGFNWFSGL